MIDSCIIENLKTFHLHSYQNEPDRRPRLKQLRWCKNNCVGANVYMVLISLIKSPIQPTIATDYKKNHVNSVIYNFIIYAKLWDRKASLPFTTQFLRVPFGSKLDEKNVYNHCLFFFPLIFRKGNDVFFLVMK